MREDSKQSYQPVLNVEQVDFTNPRQKLSSPRSIEACRRLGIKIKDLYFQDFSTFKLQHPGIINLSKEVQNLRWQHLEETRQNFIQMVRMEREKVIADQFKESSKEYDKKEKCKSLSEGFSSTEGFKTSAIEQEKRAIEKIKKKQKQDIQNLIENEMRMTMIRQENEEKIQKQLEKEEKMQKKLLEKRKIQEEERKKKQLEREEQQLREFQEQEKKNYERFLEEQRKIEQEKEMEKKLKKDRLRREKEQKLKQEKFRRHTEKIFLEQQTKIKERQEEMEERDKQRLEALEKKRIESLIEGSKKRELHERKLEITKMNLEMKLKEQKEEFEKKQQLNEEKRKYFEEVREETLIQQKEKSLKRQQEIKKVLEKNKLKEMEKIEEYFEKQDELEKQRIKIEQKAMKEAKKRKRKMKEKEYQLELARRRNFNLEQEKVHTILEKMTEQEERIKKKFEEDERNAMLKQENNLHKREDKSRAVQRLVLVQEYMKEKSLEFLREKQEKADEIKRHKEVLLQKRKKIAEKVSKQKKEIMEKFDKTMKGNKEMNTELIRELFPGEEGDTLIEKITIMKSSLSKSLNRTTRSSNNHKSNYNTLYSSNNQNHNNFFVDSNRTFGSQKKFNNSNGSPKLQQNSYNIKPTQEYLSSSPKQFIYNNTSYQASLKELPDIEMYDRGSQSLMGPRQNDNKNAVMSYEEANGKIEAYRQQLNKELLRIINLERKKEEERNKVYASIEDPEERQRLQREIAGERIASSQRIVKLNGEMEEKIREYEERVLQGK